MFTRIGRLNKPVLVLADQATSSIANLVLVSAVARLAPVETFGKFATLYLLAVFWIAANRGWFATRLSLMEGKEAAGRETAISLLAVLATAPLVCLSILAVGSVLGAGFAPSAAVASFAVLASLLDIFRFALVALREPGKALTSDLLWLVIVVLVWLGDMGEWSGWAALVMAPLLALGYASFVFPLPLEWRSPEFRRAVWSGGAIAQLVNALWGVGSWFFVTLAVTKLGGDSAAAGLQAASIVMSPPLLLISSTAIGLTPWLAVRDRSRDVLIWLLVNSVGVVLLGVWVLAVVLVPEIGKVLAGPSWGVAGPFVAAVVLQRFAAVLMSSTNALLRVRRRDVVVFWQIGLGLMTLVVVLAYCLALPASAEALVWGLAFSWLLAGVSGSFMLTLIVKRESHLNS